jgi:membrane associated rhomboid family serine protease
MIMLQMIADSFVFLAEQTQKNVWVLSNILLLLWGIFAINRLVFGNRLLYLGIQPRHIIGLPGIICAPFLHANFNHLFFNSIPLVVLADFILIQGIPHFLQMSLLIILVSGILIWCFASPGLHVGASGVITGYWGYLVAHAYYQSTMLSFILAAVCFWYFAGIFYSIFPGKRHVSWQGHLYGLLSGLAVAYYL